MTVADNTSRNQYTATSGQTVFAYTFEIVDKGDIVVLQNGTTLSEGTNYTVSGVGAENGGNITLTVGATTGDVMTIYRDMAYSRTQNYADSGDFLASEVNSDFDNLWLAGEQTNRAFSQSIRKPITDPDSLSMELPDAAARAESFLTFDETGAVTVSQITEVGAVSSDVVTYTPAGADAVKTTVQAKLRESISVKDFGAKGDGTTDDTTAIQNAINYASNNEVQTIYFPEGHYKYTTLRLYHDATDNPNFQETPNRDGRFVFLGTGKLGLPDLKFLKTEPNRIYGSILESTSGGSGIIVEPTGTFSGTDARNFRGESMTFIADNTGYIVTSESCPGISFSNCSFKQFNTGGSGLKIRNAWFFTMDQCFIYGPSDTGEPAVNTGDAITGESDRFAGLWNVTNSLIDAFSNGIRWTGGEFVNVSIRNTAIQNCNNHGFYAEGGILQQLLFDNVYQENVGVRGRSFIKGTGSGISTARIRNLRMTSSFMYGPYMTGPLVDLDSVESIDCEHLYVYRPRQTFLNVTDTKNSQISAGKLENCAFATDEDVANYYASVNGSTTVFTGPYAQVATDLAVYVDDGTGSNYTLQTLTTDYTVSDLDNIDGATSTVTFTTAPVAGRSIKIIRPITLLTGIMPSVNNCIYPTVDKGFYFTADPDGSTSRRQFIRLYDEITKRPEEKGLLPSYVDLKGTTGIAKFGFGDTKVITVPSGSDTFAPATPEDEFTYTFNSPDAANRIKVERKPSGGSFTETFDFTVNLSTKLVTLDTATSAGEEVRISTGDPYNISGADGRTYYDLTHSIATGLKVILPDTGEINDGRLFIIKNNESTTSSAQYPYINVVNNTAQTTTIAQLSPGQAGLFIMDKQDGNNFKYVGKAFTDDLELVDNHKITFGRGTASGPDMEIYHDSTSGESRIDVLDRLHINDTVRIEPRATAPSSPGAGDIYYDSTTNKLRCYNGTTWNNLF